MTIELRRVTAEDWAVWRPVRLAALTDAPQAFGSRLEDWQDAPEHRWRTRLSLPGAVDLLAVEEGDTVGMASGVPDPDDLALAELISMWVAPGARGRGLVARLVDEVARVLVVQGTEHLELSVMPDNDRARRAYERIGFSATDTPGDRLPDGRTETVMRRDLSAERTLLAYERGADRWTERTDGHRAGLVDDLLGLVPGGAQVLELGSGPGRDADALEAAGLRVDRTDGTTAFVDRLRAAGHEARVLDVRRDGWGGPYDAVVANAVLLHVARSDTPAVLERARRAVRPGGVLAATVKRGDGDGQGDGWSDRKLDDPRWFTYWDEDALAAAVTTAGWHDVRVRETTRPGAEERWLTVTARRPEEDQPDEDRPDEEDRP
ncbi:bifunctional GNAT family N-acetyltransferase/class I SAM-dependent methyltransferase [Curtobacterium sp. P97]|uniref:GNAT family N-acetyltransferase n=1 Tax=Curtobacterium sp. P97 TaxID=2939562 RepID=UPI00203CA38D|nr:bifunctional GNAT family N-acetyltransferase/class I SAM-dependent methyltransferase [Curtobacterium sp. P97]MCM3522377.1 bifunctional GNAT family N-acetyltransferase/class I SAM-dependent methyltransferase [Curtobacterium sp. P97]